jgi:hypothetical protein
MKPRKITLADYIGMNLCLFIPWHYGFMSDGELIALFITIPFAIVWWTVYGVIMDKMNEKRD